MIVEPRPRCDAPFNAETAISVKVPREQRVPVVFASPHSGRDYPADLLTLTRLDPLALRRSEDAYVDELFDGVVELGAPLIAANFPRAYLDANREAMELDPQMFSDPLPACANTRSPRAVAGIGTIARIVSGGQEIYNRPLRFSDAEQRIETCYLPYHGALRSLVDATMNRFGRCLVVDCHSMPSGTVSQQGLSSPRNADIVLGDCWGSSCDQGLVRLAERTVLSMGYAVRRNMPYAGGYTTRLYGRPDAGIHALQIEIDRSLYMDEHSITKLPVFGDVQARMMELATALRRFEPDRAAAE